MVKAIVGANWGDEGKGKITDILAAESDVVVRFQGGSNAGHTIIHDKGKFVLHQMPSGVFYPHVTNIIGNGTALNIEFLQKEIKMLQESGIQFQLQISDRAHVLLPHHILLDTLEEERLGDQKFGSTKSGIAPLYADKYAKTGIQVHELYDSGLKDKLYHLCEKTNLILEAVYSAAPIDASELYQSLSVQAKVIEPFVTDTSLYLHEAIRQEKNILLEGQLGALKDTDHGIYPYVTSSSTLAGFASVGAGIPPYAIQNIVAVTKAYSSAVGEGPFVSEILGEEAQELRQRGGDAGEFGATTGRPRRVGYFDAVATRYGCRLQGATEVALTGLDVLSFMSEIPVCTGYEIQGKVLHDFPVPSLLKSARPVYTSLPGWKKDIRGVKSYAALPKEAQDYIQFLQKELGVPVRIISNGPKRDEWMRYA